jgi:hypothetical protein
MNRRDLTRKLGRISSGLLKEKGYISVVDVFAKLGYLTGEDIENWRRRRVPYLERVIRVSLGRINFIMKTVRRNSTNGGLKPSWTAYRSWGKGKKVPLRFTKTGDRTIEEAYATHFVSKRKKKVPTTTSDSPR